jgi:pimeloyl-ACP methyl ester carboxylesterase
MLPRQSRVERADAAKITGASRDDDVLIHALPIYHTHGLFVASNVMLFSRRLDDLPAEIRRRRGDLKLMPRATSMMGVPTFYVRLVAASRPDARGDETYAAVRVGLRAAAGRDAPRIRERTGHAILERYGMTETNMNTSNPYDGDRVAGTVGFPLPGVARVTDPRKRQTLAEGEIGMIEVKGPNVFKGYWRMPEKTKAEFRDDGFFITGDLGKIDERGYVHIVGRGKDLVISGGFNVYPKEVESEIDALPGVVESAVIGVPHADFGEGVTAVVVRGQGRAIDERVCRCARRRLAKFKLPKKVMFVDDLPRNTMGKVQKNVLREIAKVSLIVGIMSALAFGYLMTRPTPSYVAPAMPPAHDVTLTAQDGVRLAASYWPGRVETAPGILLLHGVGGSRVIGNAEWLAARGYAVLAIDFRGHGQSDSAIKSFGLYEARDARVAFDWLKQKQSGAPVAVIGISLGGAAALLGEGRAASGAGAGASRRVPRHPAGDLQSHGRARDRKTGLADRARSELSILSLVRRRALGDRARRGAEKIRPPRHDRGKRGGRLHDPARHARHVRRRARPEDSVAGQRPSARDHLRHRNGRVQTSTGGVSDVEHRRRPDGTIGQTRHRINGRARSACQHRAV